MVALRANKFVCSEIEVIALVTSLILALLSSSLAIVTAVFSASSTASVATLAASWALSEISRMLAVISSTPVATVSTLWLTCSADADTTIAWAEVSSALAAIWWLTDVSSSEAPLSERELSAIVLMAEPICENAWLRALLVCPTSSPVSISRRSVRSPFATWSATRTTSARGLTMARVTVKERTPRTTPLISMTRMTRLRAFFWLDFTSVTARSASPRALSANSSRLSLTLR